MGISLSLTYGQLEVTAPASVAGTYNALGAAFGDVGAGFSGMLVEIEDNDGLTTGCVGIANADDVAGNVALIDRGACGFTVKVLNAQAAGATAVVVCNNDQDNPDDIPFNMGGGNCEVDLPSAMISYNDCQTLRAETGVMATFTPDLPAPTQANEYLNMATTISDGTHTVDSISGSGGLFSGSTGAAYYEYTAAADGVVNISSCGGGADTRLLVLDCASNLLAFSIDDCDDGNGNVVASNLDLLLLEGQTIYISWDDAQSADGFDFTVSLNALPTVNVTFTVNMEEETVANDGVFFHYDINDVPIGNELMTDNGDGTWSYTIEVTTLDTINYVYCNGANNFEVVPEECAFPNFQGNPVREHVMLGITDGALSPVCYELCTNCPSVNVSFTVDMSNEMVSPDGVNMVYAGPGVTDVGDVSVVALSDNGDGTWSGTVGLMTGDTIGYAFVNGGVAVENVEAVPDDCGLLNSFGFNIRPLIVEGFEDIDVGVVCFGTCTSFCPVEGCETTPILMENLDNYTTGELVGPQSDVWAVWDGGAEGGDSDAPVVDEQAFSPPNSVKIEGNGGPDDVLLNLGNLTDGKWDLRFKLYVEPGFAAYYNIQDNENSTPNQWNLDVGFETDGTLGEDVTGTYTQGEWIDVIHIIDLDNNWAELIIEGQSVYTWVYEEGWKIGSFDFFPRSGSDHLFYLDDFVLRPITPCPEGSIICDGFEPYADGPVSDQSAFWAPWTSSPADDGIVTEEQAYEGCNSLKITDEDPDDQLLLLGDRTEGNYLLEWWMYIPEGSAGYYNMQKFQDDPGATGGFAHQVEFFADGTATLDAGAADVVTWDWTAGEWFQVQHFIDLDNDWLVYMINGEEIYSYPASWGTFEQSGEKQIGSIDFFGNTDVIQYLDNVLFQQLPSIPGNLCGGAIDINDHLGGGTGTTLSSGPYDNTNYTTSGDPDFGYECFGEPDGLGGAPTLERTIWYTFTGDGNTYFIEALGCGTDTIDFNDTQIAIYSGACDNLVAAACSEDGPNAASGFFPAGLEFPTEDGTVYYMMVDGFGPDFPADGEFCLEFTQLTQANVDVTVSVDMTNEINWGGGVSGEGVFISGEFNGWANPGDAMTDQGNGIWEITLSLAPNDTIEYKFQNGTDGWENIDETQGGPCTLQDFGNRFVITETDPVLIDPVCFNKCVACNVLDIDQAVLENGVSVFPNPAKDIVNVRFELPQATDNLHLRMVNALGQSVYATELGQIRAENVEVNVSELPAGAYMIQLIDGQTSVSRSVIVE